MRATFTVHVTRAELLAWLDDQHLCTYGVHLDTKAARVQVDTEDGPVELSEGESITVMMEREGI